MTLYFTLQIYNRKLGHPGSLTESPSTSISSSGAFGANLGNLAMTQLPGWQAAAKWSIFSNLFENPYKSMEIINVWFWEICIKPSINMDLDFLINNFHRFVQRFSNKYWSLGCRRYCVQFLKLWLQLESQHVYLANLFSFLWWYIASVFCKTL